MDLDIEELKQRAGILDEQMVTDEDYVLGSLNRVRTRMEVMAHRNPQMKTVMDHLDQAIGELAKLKGQGGGF